MSETWYHARSEPILAFSEDTPAFFTDNDYDLSLWSGQDGFVVTADLRMENPIAHRDLHKIALEMGMEDCFNEEFSDFPDVSSYLYNPEVRRRLESLGYDGYKGEDGYLWVTVVWNPDQISVLTHEPYIHPAQRASTKP